MDHIASRGDMYSSILNDRKQLSRHISSGSILPLILWSLGAALVTLLFVFGTEITFGALPGDISIMAGITRLYLPFATTILVSVVITGLFHALGNYFSRH
jgi:hypothetical protein